MSGSFENMDVPPTLVSFAVSISKTENIITPEFKKAGSYVYILKPPYSVFEKCNFTALRDFFDNVERLILKEKNLSCWAAGSGGTAEAVFKMCLGNRIGFTSEKPLVSGFGFHGFIIETEKPLENFMFNEVELLGRTTDQYILRTADCEGSLDDLQESWEKTLEPVYPYLIKQNGKTELFNYGKKQELKSKFSYAKPEFVIPVFPGTNSEYDTVRAIEKAGGKAKDFVIRNLTSEDIAKSVKEF
jgi:phosphoribosylformylglycinamidine synthase